MNDRRVVAVFGPLLIGSALQRKAKKRRRKKVARIIATAPIKAVRIDGYRHRHIGSVGGVAFKSSKDSFFQMGTRGGGQHGRCRQRGAVKL